MQYNQRQVLEEAERIKFEAYCLNELNDMVDYRTGEILTSRQYASQPMVRDDIDPIPPQFGAITSHTQMQRFMESKDRRRLEIFNACRSIYDMDKGKAVLEQSGVIFPTKMLLKLSRIVERIDYRNVIVTTPQELSDCVEVRFPNLHRELRSLRGLIRVHGTREGIAKGSIKVEVNPVYGFKYEASSMSYMRGEEIEIWYKSVAEDQSNLSASSEIPDAKFA